MGKRKITCNNASCKHHISGGGCDTCIMLDGSGKCKSFEKGFAYYFHIVWDALGNKNFIDMIEVQRNPDLRIGMYYVMECYELGFSEMEWGTCRMLMLKNGENGEPFYVSKEWRAMRERIIEVYDNVDIYALYVENELLTCEPVHHIVELEDDWEQRLNPFNLIPLNHKTHLIRLVCVILINNSQIRTVSVK